MSNRKSLPHFEGDFIAGYEAYQNGIRTPAEANEVRPYRLFGNRQEHARAVSWGKGWNAAKRDAGIINGTDD